LLARTSSDFPSRHALIREGEHHAIPSDPATDYPLCE
jgi:hypothetical protein